MDKHARTPVEALEIADRLDRLAQHEFNEVRQILGDFPPIGCAVLLIEACRCLDHMHVMQLLSLKKGGKLSIPDFDIVVRGWSVVFALLMQRKGELRGIPLKASTPKQRQAVKGLLHVAGHYVILNRTAEMVRHGIVSATENGNEIELELSERTLLDHFQDQVDLWKLAELKAKVFQGHIAIASDSDADQHIRDIMGKLTFPWVTSQGVMVGYDADPEVDEYFLKAAAPNIARWRDDAGIHPNAKLGGCSGGLLTVVVHLLTSFHMKHVTFVEEAIKRHADVNQYMSLTIWKSRDDLMQSLMTATSASEREVSAALELITVNAKDASYFLTEQAPCIPLVIELCDGYLLTPVSGIFRNPFNGIRVLRESTSVDLQNSFREHREKWMTEELYALFQGSRYQRVARQTKLRRRGKVVTDIDAAIFDNETGDLMLFQLKWQDFSSSNIRAQRSKAKNFTDQIQDWVEKVTSWVDDFGVSALCQALQIKLTAGAAPPNLRLTAIGRSNARFRSYGFNNPKHGILVLPWSQFVRIRIDTGPIQNFYDHLSKAVFKESDAVLDRKSLPYLLECRGTRIKFKDIWSGIEDEDVEGT